MAAHPLSAARSPWTVVAALVLVAAAVAPGDARRCPAGAFGPVTGHRTGLALAAARVDGSLAVTDLDCGTTLTARSDAVRLLPRGGVLVAWTGSEVTSLPCSESLGRADWLVPSTHADRMWLVDYRASTAREVDVHGREVTRPVHLDGPAAPIAAWRGGFVSYDWGRGRAIVRERTSGRWIERTLRPPLAASGTLIAYADDRLHVRDVLSNRDVLAAPLKDVRAATFSPGGRYLAADVASRGVTVLDVRTRRARVVRGADDGLGRDATWSQDGRWLLFGRDELEVYRAGTRTALRTHLKRWDIRAAALIDRGRMRCGD